MMNIPADLKKAICNDNLLIFVGAGLSFNLKNTQNQPLNGWRNLVQHILHELKHSGYDVDYLIPLVDKCEPIQVLDLLESNTTILKSDIYNIVQQYFRLSSENNLDLHKKLYQLSKKIITTNYDTAFETAEEELRINKAYKGRNYDFTKFSDPNASWLFKLHGCYEDADSMVLFPSNYKDLYENTHKDAEHALLVLQSIILNKTLLFIGAGMGDFQINHMFHEIKKLQAPFNKSHYIITDKTIDSSLDFLTALKIKDYSGIEDVVDALLDVKKECQNNKSPETVVMERQLREAKIQLEEKDIQLEEANKKINASEITSIQDKLNRANQLLEREALKYFIRGVKFSLREEHREALEEYKTAIELKPDFHDAFYNWGTALGNLAQTKEGKAAEDLYYEAFKKYQQAVTIQPDYHKAFNNWGTDLGKLAQTKEGQAAEDLYYEAFEKYQQAIDIQPDLHQAFYNWGTYLVNLAQTIEGQAAEDLYYEAFEKYQQAVSIQPDFHQAFYNWGTYLVNLAQTKEGQAAEELYHEAFEKYQQAVTIQPDDHEAFYNWGYALGNLAQTKEGQAAEELYHEAFEKYQQAIEYGAGYYNLSCLYALKGEKEQALKYLEMSLYNKEISVDFVEEDKDWESYLKDSALIALFQQYR